LVSQLQHGLTLEFEHSDSPRRLRLVLSELLAIMNKVNFSVSGRLRILCGWKDALGRLMPGLVPFPALLGCIHTLLQSLPPSPSLHVSVRWNGGWWLNSLWVPLPEGTLSSSEQMRVTFSDMMQALCVL